LLAKLGFGYRHRVRVKTCPACPAGDAHGRRFLLEDAVVASSIYDLLLQVKTLDPLGSGGGRTFRCRFLAEGAVLEPIVCSLSVVVLTLPVKLPVGDVCGGGVRVLT
jgi:hypothetical protein